MSEYQYYAFRSIDRPLNEQERKTIDNWSSRTTPTAYGATFEYHYGDFGPNMLEAVANYFDVGYYMANWGSKRLIFRFPERLVKSRDIRQYLHSNDELELSCGHTNGYLIWDIDYNQEESDEAFYEEEYSIDTFLPIRDEILNGDYRALYIAWLAGQQGGNLYDEDDYYGVDEVSEDEDELPPPIPPNMSKLTAAQRQLAQFLNLDDTVLEAVANFSKNQEAAEIDYNALLDKLSDEEKHDFLLALANGKKRLDIALRQRLHELNGEHKAGDDLPRPSWEEISELAEEKQAQYTEKARKVAAAAEQQRLRKLAARRDMMWREVLATIPLSNHSAYKNATATLCDLRDVATFENRQTAFQERLNELKETHRRKGNFIRMLKQKGL